MSQPEQTKIEKSNPLDAVIKTAIDNILDNIKLSEYITTSLIDGFKTKNEVVLSMVRHNDVWRHSQNPSIYYNMLRLYDDHGLLKELQQLVNNVLFESDGIDHGQVSLVYIERIFRGNFIVKVSFDSNEWEDKKKMMVERLEKKMEMQQERREIDRSRGRRGEMRERGRRGEMRGRGRGRRGEMRGRGGRRGEMRGRGEMCEQPVVPYEAQEHEFQQHPFTKPNDE